MSDDPEMRLKEAERAAADTSRAAVALVLGVVEALSPSEETRAEVIALFKDAGENAPDPITRALAKHIAKSLKTGL